jgi:hypothetical protein
MSIAKDKDGEPHKRSERQATQQPTKVMIHAGKKDRTSDGNLKTSAIGWQDTEEARCKGAKEKQEERDRPRQHKENKQNTATTNEKEAKR